MCPNVLYDASFFAKLVGIDRELAEKTRLDRCPACNGPLHQANYFRKPRGGPTECDDTLYVRFSFCCGREGCRKRMTPPSVRFLGRKEFFGSIVVLLSSLFTICSPDTLRKLCALHKVSRRTFGRWREWWQGRFAESQFWKETKGLLNSPPVPADLPNHLLDRFSGSPAEKLVSCLRFLTPISTKIPRVGLAF